MHRETHTSPVCLFGTDVYSPYSMGCFILQLVWAAEAPQQHALVEAWVKKYLVCAKNEVEHAFDLFLEKLKGYSLKCKNTKLIVDSFTDSK